MLTYCDRAMGVAHERALALRPAVIQRLLQRGRQESPFASALIVQRCSAHHRGPSHCN